MTTKTIKILMDDFGRKNKISDLAGTWDISEEEVETIIKRRLEVAYG